MLRFTDNQAAAILNARRTFNNSQRTLAAQLGDSAAFIGNALPIPREVWGDWDRESVELQRSTLTVFNSLSASVAKPMNIGKLIHYFRTISDSGDINLSLDGRSKARTDKPVFDYHGTPLPIIDSTFSFGWREMLAAQSEGENLDDAARMNAFRRVAEQQETLMLDGSSAIVVGGDQMYGLRTHPKRNTRSTGATLNGGTGAEWLAEVNATVKLLHDANFKTGCTLYVNFDDWYYAQNNDFKADGDKTIAQRIMETGGVNEVVAGDSIAADEMIAVVKDRRVLNVLNGMPMSTRAQFRANPEDDYNFVTMAAVSLEVKFDAEDNCGIAHST